MTCDAKRWAAHSVKVAARKNDQHIQVYPETTQVSNGRDALQLQLLGIAVSLLGPHLSATSRARWWCVFELRLRQYLDIETPGGRHE